MIKIDSTVQTKDMNIGHKYIQYEVNSINPWRTSQTSLIALSASAIRSLAISLLPVMLRAAARSPITSECVVAWVVSLLS